MSLVLWKSRDTLKAEDRNIIMHRFRFHFELSTENFELLKQEGGSWTSTTFNGDQNHGDEWRVQFDYASPIVTKFTLQLVHSESKEQFSTAYQFCVVDGSKEIRWAGAVKKEKFLQGRKNRQNFQNFHIDAWLNPQDGNLVDDSIRFCVQISTQRLESKRDGTNPPFVTDQLKSFLINGNFADVILASGNCTFQASKIILAAQSPVFCAMFNSEMLESKSQSDAEVKIEESEANAVVKIEELKSNAVVQIKDFSNEIIQGFLEFVYTGETESLEENAGELLKISDKYQVMGLKEKCEMILLENLKIENTVDILVLAHLYSPQELKPKVMSFVNKHFKDLKGTEPYARMKKEYPQIMFDLYENAMN